MRSVKTWQITPDRTVDNKKGHEFTRSLHDYLYRPLYKRFDVRQHAYRPIERVWYIIRLTTSGITFHFAASPDVETFLKQRLSRYWMRSAVSDAELPRMKPTQTLTAEMRYTRHNIFSLAGDWREDTVPIASIINVVRDMREGDEARLLVCIQPYDRTSWSDWAERAHNEFKSGKTPQRRGISGRLTVKNAAKLLDNALEEASDTVDTIFDGSDAKRKDIERRKKRRMDMEKREIMLDGRLDRATLQKRNEPVFKTRIFIVSHSEDVSRRLIALRSLGNAFSELSGDNELKRVEHNGSSTRMVDRLNRWEIPFDMDANLMSATETGKLFQLPTAAIQDEYAEYLHVIERRETGLPEQLIGIDGIPLGSISFRGKVENVMMPIKNWDELCLPRAVIGAMGVGKTGGFGGNWGAWALKHGFSVFSIDVAKDELGDEIEQGARKLGVTNDKFVHLFFGERPIRLDWPEASHGKRAANRLSGEVLNFFNLHGHEAGIETARYIRLAAKTIGTIGGSLDEMLRLFTDAKWRKECTERVKRERPDLCEEWQVYDGLSDGMKGKVTDPILNRLDLLLGDDYMRECFRCKRGVDFTRYMTGGYHVRIHVPKRDLGPETTDILVDFLMSKIELAMFARPEDKQVPAFVIADEPHQFRSCAPRWERMTVESRKWRLALVFMFHLWDQVPKTLTNSIKAAGAHYHVYTTSKQILRDLAEEIEPFTVEEALNTPRHYAINVIRSGGKSVTPFMAKMSAPPSTW